MPESPEVQALIAALGPVLTGRTIAAIDLVEARAYKTRGRPVAGIVGARVTGLGRFGKHLDVETDRGSLVVSFGRAGWAYPRAAGDADATLAASDADGDDPPVIATIVFDDDSTLDLTDAADWLSLGLSWVDLPIEVAAIAALGPDPLGPTFTREDFARALGARRKQLKALLQEQESLAGIGNAYSDEILHAAKISPRTHAAALDDLERERLFQAVRSVLTDAVAARTGIGSAELKAAKVAAMRVHGRTGEACPVCGATVLDVPGTKGGAQYCPTCQTAGVPLEG
ncbi:DNA-formamidopyrimidine glycosylase family protein [Microbacterium hominis]|uniref:Fpg/Nei family DNA glycosylase n=1 Tax=Microbacterium hominis TaxID=162426 RepID=A0A7D4UHZ5_9MICO|nr:DNA-formamidopyrimidine glycosylase family protein [Microbacterium hominis]QKJ19088.1 Fpg/Nei family DNA glycosylase [Microbacterium hominis]